MFHYAKEMKKLIFTAALLLTGVGAKSPLPRFQDPVPECPPNCGSGQVIAMVR
jgi:hypothetical protein